MAWSFAHILKVVKTQEFKVGPWLSFFEVQQLTQTHLNPWSLGEWGDQQYLGNILGFELISLLKKKKDYIFEKERLC
jgi:hypothetical protein